MTKSESQRQIIAFLAVLLAKHGFEAIKRVPNEENIVKFTLEEEATYCQFWLHFLDREFIIQPYFTFTYKAMSSLRDKAIGHKPGQAFPYWCPLSFRTDEALLCKNEYRKSLQQHASGIAVHLSVAGLEAAVWELYEKHFMLVAALREAINAMDKFDDFINKHVLADPAGRMYDSYLVYFRGMEEQMEAGLLAAYLTNNPRLGEIANVYQRHAAAGKAVSKRAFTDFTTLGKYLGVYE